MDQWRKVIPESRDRSQSKLLVWIVGSALAVSTSLPAIRLISSVMSLDTSRRYHNYPSAEWLWVTPWIVSLTFGLLVWAARAATIGGVFSGSAICLLTTLSTERGSTWYSSLPPLLALFLLTFAATRAGKQRKVRLNVAEGRHGRNAGQVIANLGVAGLLPLTAYFRLFDWNKRISPMISFSEFVLPTLILAALCEATADTVSSEIGQAFGGTPLLLTSLRQVPPGTDGAVSLVGTISGIFAAALVAWTGMWSMHLRQEDALIALTGGIGGLLFDSVLGATVERKGWLGNDLVNFSSTAFAALVALLLLRVP